MFKKKKRRVRGIKVTLRSKVRYRAAVAVQRSVTVITGIGMMPSAAGRGRFS